MYEQAKAYVDWAILTVMALVGLAVVVDELRPRSDAAAGAAYAAQVSGGVVPTPPTPPQPPQPDGDDSDAGNGADEEPPPDSDGDEAEPSQPDADDGAADAQPSLPLRSPRRGPLRRLFGRWR